MKKNITINHSDETMTMTKAFYKKACTFGTAEYHELRAAMQDCTGYKIEFKSSNKKSYKALTFQRMKEYIKTQPNSKSRLLEFEAVKRVAKTKGGLYPLTKKWFLATYPKYNDNSVSKDETATLTDTPVAEAGRKAEETFARIESADKPAA